VTRLKQFAFAFAVLALAACSQKEEAPAPAVAKEIKGKPIARAEVTNGIALTQAVVVAAGPTLAATNSAPELINGYSKVGFEKLSAFHYIMPDDVSPTNQPPKDQFPAEIKSLNQKPIALRGFMLPLKIEQGLVTEMLIMKDQSMCCFGSTPKINEWVSVKMSEKGVKPVMDQPVTVFGELKVGEMRENGYLVGIYEMAGHKMDAE
jgi:hypothetical protein